MWASIIQPLVDNTQCLLISPGRTELIDGFGKNLLNPPIVIFGDFISEEV
jgi:hypothetical protein